MVEKIGNESQNRLEFICSTGARGLSKARLGSRA